MDFSVNMCKLVEISLSVSLLTHTGVGPLTYINSTELEGVIEIH